MIQTKPKTKRKSNAFFFIAFFLLSISGMAMAIASTWAQPLFLPGALTLVLAICMLGILAIKQQYSLGRTSDSFSRLTGKISQLSNGDYGYTSFDSLVEEARELGEALNDLPYRYLPARGVASIKDDTAYFTWLKKEAPTYFHGLALTGFVRMEKPLMPQVLSKFFTNGLLGFSSKKAFFFINDIGFKDEIEASLAAFAAKQNVQISAAYYPEFSCERIIQLLSENPEGKIFSASHQKAEEPRFNLLAKRWLTDSSNESIGVYYRVNDQTFVSLASSCKRVPAFNKEVDGLPFLAALLKGTSRQRRSIVADFSFLGEGAIQYFGGRGVALLAIETITLDEEIVGFYYLAKKEKPAAWLEEDEQVMNLLKAEALLLLLEKQITKDASDK